MNALNELWQAEKKQRILVLCNENEIAGLQAQGVPVSCEDSLLSMQHLKMARLEAERRHKLNEGLQFYDYAGACAGYGSGAGADLCHACALPQGYQLP
mgnify:CR=1 FL=1